MEGTIGEIRLFAATFAPRDWSYCDGSLIQIRSNTALFSILGTNYGGDGQNTFALPDLRGRTALGTGQGPGLSYYALGQKSGVNNVTLTNAQLPSHTHVCTSNVTISAYSDEGDSNSPTGNVLAAKAAMYSTIAGDTAMKAAPFSVAVSVAGSSQPLPLNQPSLGLNYIICMFGIFPSRQ
ncbi:tail fiber protein [Flavobacterium sp. Fl-77]|uniref:Tail fiber protein n=1 Tax=Flavobacterium flavipigmentatum TaxID=2893884 RepID=A0AAJ2VYW0_9FLAO|nr:MULTISPECIES: tail fiber protein [unclassified Flavobacterium]MDX6183220.1 tail fiber protein [Flavobacterium sp. Fl-33]MDX6187618.1 tail fiber protein [Flavobacterium sp. Fl-77]UFH40367.1 tail fiber protein [Flavobacterium sp. F-70]